MLIDYMYALLTVYRELQGLPPNSCNSDPSAIGGTRRGYILVMWPRQLFQGRRKRLAIRYFPPFSLATNAANSALASGSPAAIAFKYHFLASALSALTPRPLA
jgi:hypothetical protein